MPGVPIDPYASYGGSSLPAAPASTSAAPAQTPTDPYASYGGASLQQPTQPEESMLGKAADFAEGMGTGFVKGAGQTVSGVSHLLNKIPGVGETLAPSQGVTALDQMATTHGTAEAAGSGLENIAEFAAGDEALEGLSKAVKFVSLAKKYPVVAEALNMAKDHPILAKLISGGSKAATVGAAQGALKGEATGKAGEEAAGGAIGGAVGGAAGEAAASLEPIRNTMRLFGLGGLTSEEAMTKAAKPRTGYEGRNFADWWDKAKPAIKDIPNSAIKTVGDFEDILHDKANTLWTNTIAPQVERHANEIIDGAPIAKQIRQGLAEGTQELFPEESAPVEKMAQHFADSKLSLDKADGYLRTLNAKLRDYYRMAPETRNAIGMTSGRMSAMEDAASGLRDQIYNKLEDLGEDTPREFRQQYGALKGLEQTFGKRANVVDRQQPLNISQVLGMSEAGTALLAGHPVTAAAGAIPFITKARGSTKSLIKQGLSAAREEAGTPGVIQGAANAVTKAGKAVLGTALPVAGAEAGEAAGGPSETNSEATAGAAEGNPAGTEGTPEETPGEEKEVAPVHDLVLKAAEDHGIPAGLLFAQARQESKFDQNAVSKAGARGVMQLEPTTAEILGVDPDKVDENIEGGARYMKQLHEQFKQWDKALAAYNAGPTRVKKAVEEYGDDWLDHLPNETQKYVENIMKKRNAKSIEGNESSDKEEPQSSEIVKNNSKSVPGLVEQGNIDVNHRPIVWNDDGSPSTIFSATIPIGNGKWALVPTIANGKFLTPDGKIPKESDKKAMAALEDKAEEYYKKTGEHLGIFNSQKAADDYADKTHAYMPDGSSEKVYVSAYKGDSNMPLTRKEYEAELAKRNGK